MLPSLDSQRLFVGDGGLETAMIFDEGFELPCFAAFVLLESDAGRAALRCYYEGFLDVADRNGVGFLLDTPTWRASRDWGERLGYPPDALDQINRVAVAFGTELKDARQTERTPIAVCGTVGPRGDAYSAAEEMSAAQAADYHGEQISALATAGAEMVSAYTLPYAAEAAGIVHAADRAGVPVTISFTVETDGRLPSGQPLGEAIVAVDDETGGAAAYFMVNCAHPTHYGPAVVDGGAWLDRLGGARPNASRRSHAELDEAEELDRGDPEELGELYADLRSHLPALRVLGGCCGTDRRHVTSICERWLASA